MLVATACSLSFAFSVPPLQMARHGLRGTSCMCTISDDEMEFREPLSEMRAAGKTDAEIMEIMASQEGSDLVQFGESSEAPPKIPTSGFMEWGRWAQTEDTVYVELCVERGTKAKAVSCEALVGFLDVRIAEEPVLCGRLVAEVESEPEWALDENEAGVRILCMELRKRYAGGVVEDAVFSSLRVYDEEVAAPGLVRGKYLPLEAPGPLREVDFEEQYGSYDNTVADQAARAGWG